MGVGKFDREFRTLGGQVELVVFNGGPVSVFSEPGCLLIALRGKILHHNLVLRFPDVSLVSGFGDTNHCIGHLGKYISIYAGVYRAVFDHDLYP
jgi:hypothetical protein